MKINKRTLFSLSFCVGIMIICFILIALLSGFRYEYKKFKKFLLTTFAVIILRYIIWEHIEFLLNAFICAVRDYRGNSETIVTQHKQEYVDSYDENFKPMDYLKLRLNSLKSQLFLEERHKNEELNLEYKQLTQEFWFFGKYFLLLLLLIVYSHNSYGYYSTATIRRALNESYFTNYKLKKVLNINDFYYWINGTLTSALNGGYGYDVETGWAHFHLSKLLGVVRLQQVRHAKKVKSMTTIYFDENDYLPNWKQLNRTLYYIDKYWRIYYPWLSKHYKDMANWLMGFTHPNSLYTYQKHNGYVVLLARDRQNSEKILKFLKDQNWLDNRTAAVFIDFTLYNVDANIFTICSMLVEQTPFGNLVWELSVQSAELLTNINEISLNFWLLIGLYIFQLIQFCKVMVIRAWFVANFFKSRWNCVDFAIVLLNILLFIFVLIREYYVLYVMKTFILSEKIEYVDFRVACLFNYVAAVIMGLLICLATLRIWKILQFSSIFRIFNRTLYTASEPLLSTILGIHIFLSAIGLSAEILNGSQSEIFSRYLKSLTSIMSFSFGFNSRADSSDLRQCGGVLGFALYIILMFVVAIFLINMFITLICDHFANARDERDQEPPNKLTYWEFLKMEYSYEKIFYEKLFSYSKAKEATTISENVHSYLNKLENYLQEQQTNADNSEQVVTEDEQFEADRKKADHMHKVAEILNVQMEILDRLIMVQTLEWDTDDDE